LTSGVNLCDDHADQSFHRSENDVTRNAAGSQLPLLGLMLGDYTGIGAEQCARVLADGRLDDAARLLVVGDTRVMEQGARDAGVALKWRAYAAPEEVDWLRQEIPVLDLKNLDPSTIKRRQVSPESGRITGETLAHMIDLAL
jgi:4-hydroxy-L-threonine phosphate dehydrogenase PdxA